MTWCRKMGEFEMKSRNDEKVYRNNHVWPSLRKMLSREQLFWFTLLYTSPAYAENKWRLVWYDFLKYLIRNIVTPWMATLIVSWASTCLVIVHGIQYTSPVQLIQLLISNIIWFYWHLFKQQTWWTSNESYFIYLNMTAYTERNLIYIYCQNNFQMQKDH